VAIHSKQNERGNKIEKGKKNSWKNESRIGACKNCSVEFLSWPEKRR
jgi:hypothetical protein